MELIQLARDRILYPGLVQGDEPFRREVEQLKRTLPPPRVKFMSRRMIVLRDVTREELKNEIRNLFSNGQTLYFSDIAEQLRVDLKSVVDVCRELQENGEIGVDNSVSPRAL